MIGLPDATLVVGKIRGLKDRLTTCKCVYWFRKEFCLAWRTGVDFEMCLDRVRLVFILRYPVYL